MQPSGSVSLKKVWRTADTKYGDYGNIFSKRQTQIALPFWIVLKPLTVVLLVNFLHP